MYKCDDCGTEFDAPDEWGEYRGECFGFPAYETVCGCPRCGGSYEEIDEKEEGAITNDKVRIITVSRVNRRGAKNRRAHNTVA